MLATYLINLVSGPLVNLAFKLSNTPQLLDVFLSLTRCFPRLDVLSWPALSFEKRSPTQGCFLHTAAAIGLCDCCSLTHNWIKGTWSNSLFIFLSSRWVLIPEFGTNWLHVNKYLAGPIWSILLRSRKVHFWVEKQKCVCCFLNTDSFSLALA